jgi:hypothetical protein
MLRSVHSCRPLAYIKRPGVGELNLPANPKSDEMAIMMLLAWNIKLNLTNKKRRRGIDDCCKAFRPTWRPGDQIMVTRRVARTLAFSRKTFRSVHS